MITTAGATLRGWIRPELVRADVPAADSEAVLEALASILAEGSPEIRRDQALAEMWRREQLGSTGIGEGCAIPHARLPRISRPVLAVARTEAGVEFGAADGVAVRLFFGLAVPAGAAAAHLKALSTIARWLRQPGHREQLMAAPDAGSMSAVLAAGGEE